MNDLRSLEIFRAVAVSRSFSRAADRLHLSQPVISRHVRDLERSVGVRLFERTTRSVVLTSEGRELLAIAVDLLDRYDGAMGRFAAYCQGDRGSIVIAALPSVAAGLLPAMLAPFLAAHPAVRVQILDVPTAEATRHVRTGKADLAFAEPAPADRDLNVQILRRDPFLAVLPEHHRLAGHPAVTWAALAEEPFITMTKGSSVRRLTDLAFAQAGRLPETLVEARNAATAGGMIQAGLGVSALPDLVLPLLASAPFVTRELRDPSVDRQIAVITRPGRPASPAARRFLDSLDELIGPGESAP